MSEAIAKSALQKAVAPKSFADSVVDWQDFRAVCDQSPAGMFVLRGGLICYANPALCEILGQEPDSVIGESLLSYVRGDDRCEVAKQLTGTGEAISLVARVSHGKGVSQYVKLLASRLNGLDEPTLIGAMIAVPDNGLAEREVQDRLSFERLLADLSASFVNLPIDQLDSQIDASLRTLVEFLGNDRSTLVEFGDDEEKVIVTHSFAVPGCETFPLGPFAVSRLPWFINEFRSGRCVFLRIIPDDLPAEAVKERPHCLKQGVQSNVTVPLKVGGVVLGGLTFAFLQRRCEWSNEILSRLQLVGEVFANALLRRRTEESLRTALAENEALRQQLEQDNLYLRERSALHLDHGQIVGRSNAIARMLDNADQVAVTDASVLITGETGTGKELLAQRIHASSHRSSRPMVIVNCASLPATLIESELFGRAAGAYTGAASAQIGRFELADGSTLFLDEIGEFPLELQAKLLRVLEDGHFERLGCPNTVSANVRIIAATNRDLHQAVSEGSFRADLYHRLNVFPILVPPLRDRRDDIPPLAWSFVELIGRRMGKTIKSIPRKTMQQLEEYDWPGNVRELHNLIERAMILTSGDTLHLEMPTTPRDAKASQKTMKDSEREQILGALRETGWRIRGIGGAAELLDIKPTTLEARMARLGIKRPNRRAENQTNRDAS